MFRTNSNNHDTCTETVITSFGKCEEVTSYYVFTRYNIINGAMIYGIVNTKKDNNFEFFVCLHYIKATNLRWKIDQTQSNLYSKYKILNKIKDKHGINDYVYIQNV